MSEVIKDSLPICTTLRCEGSRENLQGRERCENDATEHAIFANGKSKNLCNYCFTWLKR